MSANLTQHNNQGFGCFDYAGMQLALPIETLREVIPMCHIEALPVQANYLVGGVNLRNVMVPVIDLALLFNRQSETRSDQCIFIVRYQNHIIGIKADRLDGLFFIDPNQLKPFSHLDETNKQFMLACVKHPDSGHLFNLLNVEKLFLLPNIAAAKENEVFDDIPSNSPQHNTVEIDHDDNIEETIHLILMRTGHIEIAVDTIDIQTTVSNPIIQSTPMAKDHFKCTIRYQSLNVPASGLFKLLELKTDIEPKECFILLTQNGPIALLIESILEIIHIPKNKLSPLPKVGFKKLNFLKNILDNEYIPQAVKQKLLPKGFHHLVLNANQICADPTILDLAKTYCQKDNEYVAHKTIRKTISHPFENTEPQSGNQTYTQENETLEHIGSESELNHLTLITFMTKREMACTIEQVLEVLPLDPRLIEDTHQSNGVIRSVLTSRSRVIPVVDLTQLIHGSEGEFFSYSSILLVEIDEQIIGFIVSKLNSIDNARQIPPIPLLSTSERPAYNPDQRTQNMAEIIEPNKRLLPVVDLIACAKYILATELV